jgi:hypothetical protein
MMLSILIPSIPERLDKLKELIAIYEGYIVIYGLKGQVEILALVDNKERSIGAKCNDLIAIAQGDYIVRSDDDDRLTQVYFRRIKEACDKGVDVITYIQDARINEDRTTVVFGLKSENQDFQHNGITKRPAWHCCTWRRKFLEDNSVIFDSVNYGEDQQFQEIANEFAKTSYHINEVCHVYVHDSTKTASFDERSN